MVHLFINRVHLFNIDPEIVKAYEPYINKLSQRTYIDEKGRKRQELDGFVKKTLETSLIAAIMKFDPYKI